MKQLLLLALFTLSLYSAVSEFEPDDYQIIIGNYFDDEIFDIVEDYDMNISILGYTQDFNTAQNSQSSFTNGFDFLSSYNANHGEQLRLIKLDQQAKSVNDIRFQLSEFNRGTNIVKTVENGYILGGYTHSGQMLIASLDAQGEKHYFKKFGTANFDQLHSLIGLQDGSIIAVGTSQTSRNRHDDIFVQGLGSSDVYLVKFTSEGEIQWKKKYGSQQKDIGVDAAATDDGGFILISLTNDTNASTLAAAKFNDTGDIAWVKKFPKNGRQNAYKIIRKNDGNYLISAGFENKNTQENIRLITIDNDGNTLWEKNIYADANERLNDICIDLKGNIMGVGYAQEPNASDTDALVRYYDHNANIIWERKFGKKRQDSFKSLALLHDNSFAVAGFSNSFEDKARQMWVLKINDDGSLVKKQMKKYRDLYQALLFEFKENPQVHIYKDLRISHDGLIFKQGSSELTEAHKNVLKHFIPHLLKVISLYKTQIKNLSINGYTSTEWNAPDTQRYLNNAHLSNDRAIHILDYSFQNEDMQKYRDWITEILSTDGYSYSNLVYTGEKENKIRSRRVEFEIRLK